MDNKLYVGNLSFDTSSNQLKQLFAAYGTVTDAMVLTDPQTGYGRGIGFVQMESNESAQDAVVAMDGTEQGGRTLKVNIAKPAPNTNQREGSL